MRVGLHRSAQNSMIEGAGWWDVENGYNGIEVYEWFLAYESPRDDPSWWGGVYLRLAFDIPQFSTGWYIISDLSHGMIIPEAFFRLGFSSVNWNFWLGRRYNDKVTVNMLDYYVANLDGNGLGGKVSPSVLPP